MVFKKVLGRVLIIFIDAFKVHADYDKIKDIKSI
jgi:hypothetical protein